MGSDAEVRWVSHLLQLRTDGIVAALTTKTTVRCLDLIRCYYKPIIDFLSRSFHLYNDVSSFRSRIPYTRSHIRLTGTGGP